MKVWLEDKYLKVYSLEEYSVDSCFDKVYLCFTGVGHALGGVDVQSEEFKKLLGGGIVFFVVDKTRSWGNCIDFDLIGDVVNPFCANRSVYAIGNSMGAFLATVCSKYIYFRACICFSSQYSVHPSYVPEEIRWKKYTAKIETYNQLSLSDCIGGRTEYIFLSGDHESESVHWKRFPGKDNVFNYVFKGYDHDLASDLKKLGLLYEVIDFLIEGVSREAKVPCLLEYMESMSDIEVFRYVDHLSCTVPASENTEPVRIEDSRRYG